MPTRRSKDYAGKRSFDKTPEPAPEVEGDVDPGAATPGQTFVIHQHYARRLHFDLRLEMRNGDIPVLVSWAVPKGLPVDRGPRHLAIHVEDHPFEYGSFSGSIPKGEYGGGEVRIFDEGTYEMLEQRPGKLTFRLDGKRLHGEYHLVLTGMKAARDKEQWLVLLGKDLRPEPDDMPSPEPMLSTAVDSAFDDDAWVFEPKWDGVRAIAVCSDETKLISRNRNDITVAYPELHDVHLRLVAIDAVIDGEIVAMDDQGRPSFEKLQSRMHVRDQRQIARLQGQIPVTYLAFDLLYLDGKSLVERPLEERREWLESTIVPSPFVQISPTIAGKGKALFDAALQQNLEGIVAKKLSSKYEPGRRSHNWLKIKTVKEADLVVGGWLVGEGRRQGSIGSLMMGAYRDGDLIFVGACGTGFDDRTLGRLWEFLEPLKIEEPSFAAESLRGAPREVQHATWVKPVLVATIEYRQVTSALRLRAPSFKRLRDDVSPEDCTVDQLA